MGTKLIFPVAFDPDFSIDQESGTIFFSPYLPPMYRIRDELSREAACPWLSWLSFQASVSESEPCPKCSPPALLCGVGWLRWHDAGSQRCPSKSWVSIPTSKKLAINVHDGIAHSVWFVDGRRPRDLIYSRELWETAV